MLRSHRIWSGRGGRLREIWCERPPRLRRFGGFAPFSYWRSHPSSRGGDYARPQPSAQKKRQIPFFLCIFVSVCLTVLTHAEVIDRIIAVVEGHIITLSDLRQEREIRATLGEKAIDDNVTLARQLVDAYLIERQIADYPNIEVTNTEVDADVDKLGLSAIAAPGAPVDAARRVLLDAQGRVLEISASGIRDAVRRRIRIQKFFDVKFRQAIRPTDEEIRKYYEEVFLPETRTRGLQSIPPLTDAEMANAIRNNVIQEKLDHEVDVWLEAIRRRSNIELFE